MADLRVLDFVSSSRGTDALFWMT